MVFSFMVLLPMVSLPQVESTDNSHNHYRIMFYNVENYFDAIIDSSLVYNEFTPLGELHWTISKYEKKRNNIYKVIKAVGGWTPVTIIGLAEVENEFVVSDLINSTPLAKDGYKYIHYESKDFRGIDVALIYKSSSFHLLYSTKIKIQDPKNPEFTTRDILYVVGMLDTDTIHVFVNHWTSRYRGYLESEPLRMLASERLKTITDSICAMNKKANIILLGDFNDNPQNRSIQILTNNSAYRFNNLDLINSNSGVTGTLKFKGNWLGFDQILVTNSLLNGINGLQITTDAKIFDADFLLETDTKYLGLKTYRTNIGFKYHGGFSDHLPIYVDLISVR